jgi:hypothetical protein
VSRPSRRPDPSVDPKPYAYGLVGTSGSLALLNATPMSPTPSAAAFSRSRNQAGDSGRRSRVSSTGWEGRPESTIGLMDRSSYPSTASSPFMPVSGGALSPDAIAAYQEFGARPVSAHSAASVPVLGERRPSRSSLAALSVNLQSPTQDYFGIWADSSTNTGIEPLNRSERLHK